MRERERESREKDKNNDLSFNCLENTINHDPRFKYAETKEPLAELNSTKWMNIPSFPSSFVSIIIINQAKGGKILA